MAYFKGLSLIGLNGLTCVVLHTSSHYWNLLIPSRSYDDKEYKHKLGTVLVLEQLDKVMAITYETTFIKSGLDGENRDSHQKSD